MISFPEDKESETVINESLADSSDVVISPIENVGGLSSSVMVNIAELSTMVALIGLERVIFAVSLISSIESARVLIGNVLDISPAEKVRVPEVA